MPLHCSHGRRRAAVTPAACWISVAATTIGGVAAAAGRTDRRHDGSGCGSMEGRRRPGGLGWHPRRAPRRMLGRDIAAWLLGAPTALPPVLPRPLLPRPLARATVVSAALPPPSVFGPSPAALRPSPTPSVPSVHPVPKQAYIGGAEGVSVRQRTLAANGRVSRDDAATPVVVIEIAAPARVQPGPGERPSWSCGHLRWSRGNAEVEQRECGECVLIPSIISTRNSFYIAIRVFTRILHNDVKRRSESVKTDN